MDKNLQILGIENLTEQELQNIDGGLAFSTIALIACCFAAGLGTGLLI